jgi:hypothetical protein
MASDNTPRISPNSLANLMPPWKPGESGNPGGKPRRKPLSDALELELTPEVCKIIAQRMVEKAKEASVPHFSEIANRVEGKPDSQDNGSGASIALQVFTNVQLPQHE